ncbi:MAG: phytanoyl-CoA dioxygenase family protein [Deltaproteobacteria bacterium]
MSEDLGLISQPISDLFPQPESIDEWASYALSEEQLHEFQQNGFIHGIQLLNEDQIQGLRKAWEEMVIPDHEGREYFYEYHSNESTHPETVLFHALGAWRVRKAFHDLLWNPAFLIPAYQLLGKGIRFFHDQLFCKPANHGSVVSWHQDYSYWTWTKPMNHLTCWIGLDDSNEENGCLHYVPGSHRWGLIDKLDLAGEMDAVQDLLTPEQIRDFEKKTPIVMKAGYASFHHPVLMHGSFENRSPSQRRATVINVFGDGVVSNLDFDTVNAPGTKNYPAIPVGEKMRGSYYPLLFNPEKEFKNAENIIPKLGGLNS